MAEQIFSGGVRLQLRPLRPDDERAFVRAHQELKERDDFPFGLSYDVGTPWQDYLERLDAHERGERLPDGLVASTFLVADVDGVIVGRTSIRHELNAFLLHEGGHIGYAVLGAHRRRGYGTEILKQSLLVARARGLGRVLVTCDADNSVSAKIIERCGGLLESVVPNHAGALTRRYWLLTSPPPTPSEAPHR
jgi:predicted acetyltransferase